MLANGAGLTMTTMDVIAHFGGKPVNFLEIGGEAYTKSEVGLGLVLAGANVKSLVINFCGAFARTDVMADGVVQGLGKAQAEDSGVLFDPRHRRRRRGQAGARAAWHRALRFHGGRGEGGGRGGAMMIYRKAHRVLVQGITGKQGTFWTEKMMECGTTVVAGVNPKRAGETHIGVPVFASAADAMRRTPCDISVMFIPPAMAKDAAFDAIAAGAKLLVVLTEHIPVQDVMAVLLAARKNGTRIVGPNTAGLVTPGEGFVGIMPGHNPNIFHAGSVGVISRSGSLGTLVASI